MQEALWNRWVASLEARALEDLTFPEVRKGLQALSNTYVQRRDRLPHGGALGTRGKQAAFSLFYGPLHYLLVEGILDRLAAPVPAVVVDLGCGTGVAGAAWALRSTGRVRVLGFDSHPWAVREAALTYRTLGVDGQTRSLDAARARVPLGAGVVAAFVVNELDAAARDRLLRGLMHAVQEGSALLVVEPLALRPLPWWDEWLAAFVRVGGRADVWRWPANLPEVLRRLDRAAGLRHDEIAGRSLYVAANPSRP